MNDERKTRAQLVRDLRTLREELRVARRALGVAGVPAETPSPRADAARASAEAIDRGRAIVVEMDSHGRFTYVSPAIHELLGHRPEEMVGRSVREWTTEVRPVDASKTLREVLRSRGPLETVVRARHRDGHWVSLALDLYRPSEPDGQRHTVALARDVSEVTLAREALRSSEARYRALAENTSDQILEMDEEGNPLFVSPNCEAICGYPQEAILSGEVTLDDRIHPSDRERAHEAYFLTAEPGRSARAEYRMRQEDGTWRWLETTLRSYLSETGELRRVTVARDVTERVEAQRELKESQERYRVLTEATGDLITESDAEARLLWVSPSCERITGYSPQELRGTTPFLLVHPDDVERRIEEDFDGGRSGTPVSTRPYRVLHRDGTWHWMETTRTSYRRADGELIALRVTRDVGRRVAAEEERRRLEERMQQAQKLEGLGVMAGGIAHDFNNLLTPILGDTSLSLLDLPQNSPVRARLQRVQKAVHRAAALTNQMLAYAGEASLHVELVNLSRLAEEIGQLLETAAARRATLRYDLARNLPLIEADPARISQIVMNLITNASEAVGDRDGRVELRTGRAHLNEKEVGALYLGTGLPAGEYVFLEVTDNGPGMDAETRPRIFDPFFSTKFTGRGLGLAAVLGIVRAHEGAIELETEPGRGTRFRVLFPARRGAFVKPPPKRPDIESWRARGAVLVVDDEEGVRDIVSDSLERAGLTVLRAASGREGVKLFQDHAEEIRAVLLDRTMPGIDGEEALAELRRIRPDARVVLISGYTEEQASERFSNARLDGFLKKPFLPKTLLEKVREVIEQP